MLQLGDRLRLARQPLAGVLLSRQVRMENLHRHLALQGRVHPLVDHAHSAGADLLEDSVAPDVMSDERHARQSPKLIPRLLAARTISPFGSTRRALEVPASGTGTISPPWKPTI